MDRAISRRAAIALLLGATSIVVASCVGSTPTASPSVASPSPVVTGSPAATPASTILCTAGQLTGRITLWTGAAGSRIANISLTNAGAACVLSERVKPQLLDGRGDVLVDGTVVGAPATITARASLTSLVEVSNYCGPTPVAPVTIGLVLTGNTRVLLAPPSPTDTTVPPCNGPGAPAHMEMQRWA